MKVRFFDLCLFGRGIGGLISALTLQRRGAKVLMLTDKREIGPDPDLCEFLNGFTIKPVLKRLGFHPTEVNAIPSLATPLQLVFPEGRMDCCGDEKRFERELLREFPKRADRILQLFKESYGHLEVYQHLFNARTPFPPKGFWAQRETKKMISQVCDEKLLQDRKLLDELKSFDVGDDFERAIQSMEMALTALVTPWTNGAHLAHLLTLARWEGYAAVLGLIDLRTMLIQKLRERGAHIVQTDSIDELDFDRTTLKGAKVTGCQWNEVRWQAAIVAGDPRGLISIAPKNSKMRQWKSQLAKLPAYARKLNIVYPMNPEGMPVGMKRQGIIVPEGAPAEVGERRKRVRAVKYAVRRSPGNGHGPETLLCVTAYLDPATDAPGIDGVCSEVEEHLRAIIPFFDDFLLSRPKTPEFVPEGGSPGDFNQRLIYRADKPRLFGISGLSNETPFRNTFQVGDMVFPGLGLDGEIISGLHGAHWATRRMTATPRKL